MRPYDTEMPNLKLAVADPSYAADLFALVDRNRVYLRQWLPWLDHNTSIKDSESFLKNCRAMQASQTEFHTLMLVNNRLVGTVGYNSINQANHSAEIGYWLNKENTGQGLMTAAVKKLIEIGFSDFGLNRQVIQVAVGNNASQAIPERLGFTYEGTARQSGFHYGRYLDLRVFSLLKDQWLSGGTH